MYEALEKYQIEIDSLRRENSDLAEENMNIKMKNERDQRELDNMKKL